MCHGVTVDAFDALPTTYWQSGVWGDYDFIAVLSASRVCSPHILFWSDIGPSFPTSHRGQSRSSQISRCRFPLRKFI
jgi:hypothetical protein